MTFRISPRFTALAVLLLSLFTAARAVDASIITVEFTGTVSTVVGTVFGQSGTGLPFNVSFTYDTALGSQVAHLAGSEWSTQEPGSTLATDIYGWSAAGLTSANVTFGTKTWTVDDFSTGSSFGGSPNASVWFNADPTVVAPTALVASFRDADGRFSFGGLLLGTTMSFGPFATVTPASGFPASGDGVFNITRSADPVSTVPEPTSIVMLGTGLLGLAAHARRRGR
jgi:hypothetical protein